MAVTTRSIAAGLVSIGGRDGVIEDPTWLAAHAVDGVVPRWSIRVGNVEQVAAVLALAAEDSLAVVPRGSGSALGLGHPPARVDVLLDMRAMDRVIDYNPDDLTASVEAGVTAGALAARLDPRRQLLPVDPPGVLSRTLGGLVATAASGPLRLRYGTLRDLLLGVRFVQADGVVTWGGARVVKSVTGYDVPKLMAGSLGTLGVLCELTIRLHPRPESEATRLAVFDGIDAAAAFVARLLDSTLEPNRIELLNAAALARLGAPRATAAVAVSVGSVEAAVHAQTATIEQLVRQAGGNSASAPDEFWAAHGAMVEQAGRALTLHVASLPARLAETVRSVESAVAATTPGEDVVMAGCAALGTLDVMLPASAVATAVPLVERVREGMARLGGHAIVRRAPVELRRRIDPWGHVEPGVMALMRALRDEFDPRRVLNPGRFVGGL
jgi:glycolate oxidase FAD binding subunit